jgi:hypothetical protein
MAVNGAIDPDDPRVPKGGRMAEVESWSAEWLRLLELAGLVVASANALTIGRSDEDPQVATYKRRRDALHEYTDGVLGVVEGTVQSG